MSRAWLMTLWGPRPVVPVQRDYRSRLSWLQPFRLASDLCESCGLIVTFSQSGRERLTQYTALQLVFRPAIE